MGTWDIMKASLHDRMNSSVQNLFAEYVDASDQLELLEKQIVDSDKKIIVTAGKAYMLLLLVAGFGGDKLLKSLTDKVIKKLFAEAEKTKDAVKMTN